MDRSYEPRHICLAIGIVIAIFSLILLIFIPQTIADIVHYSSGVWQVFVPKENFLVYAIGFFLLFLAPMILFIMDIKKISILLSISFLLLSFIPFYISSQSYIIFADDSITISPILSSKVNRYSWNEVSGITYNKAKKGEMSDYEFLFQDGSTLTLEDNLYFGTVRNALDLKLKEINLIIKRVEKTSE